ncbi:hypothetical protein [Cupriavidus necator]|uniref:hypothetical protein n=1 Tax=Cupriavidus necator TaxID=106590 RepID=UPI0011D275E7|nr:hypothetical protein [Cupriavidus necator]MDX6008082.1 hypothetical protein [Cupriavidus necator]
MGATLQAIIFLTSSNRNGIINNAAIEPEIMDVIDFLNKSGCEIILLGDRSLSIGGYPGESVAHVVPTDRIHIATIMAYSIISNTSSVIEWKSPIDVSCLTNTFSELGISTTSEADKISVSVDSASRENKFDVVADVYPGFPTDAIPLVVAATIKSGRQVRFYDKVFRGRNIYKSSSNSVRK